MSKNNKIYIFKSKFSILDNLFYNILNLLILESIFPDIFDIMNDLSSQDILDILCLLEHLSDLTVNIHLALDLHLHLGSETLSDSILIVHESPDGVVLPLGIGHADWHLEVTDFLTFQRGNFNARPHSDPLS